MISKKELDQLGVEHYNDELTRVLYSTDASVYKEKPMAVVFPKTEVDIQKIVRFVKKNKYSLIPRSGGTSLAGQCVGAGISVDVSRYMNKILNFDAVNKRVTVQPGVIRDQLNEFLKPHGLFFAPNTSTANRCTIGGMVGNNSCGTTSIVYGTTRDHVHSLKVVLSNGDLAEFSSLTGEELNAKKNKNDLEGQIYQHILSRLSDETIAHRIKTNYPKPSITRRNTGYAVDVLLDFAPFKPEGDLFNMARLLCGSEGTLAFTTEITLNLSPLPPVYDIVVIAHFKDIHETMKGVLVAMKHSPTACELMDKIILDCTKGNLTQSQNRFFIQGDPGAVLMIEFRGDTPDIALESAEKMIRDYQTQNLGYAFPIVQGKDTAKVWALRAAGLGVLSNIPGEAKPIACIEDTAVDIQDLPDYIGEFSSMMEGFGQKAVYYAHAGAGEIHLRPILNLKTAEDRDLFYQICASSAKLVKKYEGSLSGEHGDGRVRAEFIPLMIGEENYNFLKEIKQVWDPNQLFNPGKIVDAKALTDNLRFEEGQAHKPIDTVFDFSKTGGILAVAEKCNGSGDCRKLSFSGGIMCPSYRATLNEKDSTRGRANALREFLTMNTKSNPFNHPELKEVMDLCLSCKACTSECPSNVDMATLKAEFQYQFNKSNGVPLKSKIFGNISSINKLFSLTPNLHNVIFTNKLSAGVIKKFLGVAQGRSLPKLSTKPWMEIIEKQNFCFNPTAGKIKTVFMFCDEFTNYNESHIGISAVKLLNALGYEVRFIKNQESGRAPISKGLLDKAKIIAQKQVSDFKDLIDENTPLIGIEPSAILSFRDEYPKLLRNSTKEAAEKLAKNVFLFEEFIWEEYKKGNIKSSQFTIKPANVLVHVHCHQASLASSQVAVMVMGIPQNYSVSKTKDGCCGMAGSFGYEEKNYELSLSIGKMGVLDEVEKLTSETIIVASGTSCRHQIADATPTNAIHCSEALLKALV
jgi:FAD/FMN-containing dehydrogenase/Fe-S oxidoreductase